MALQSQQGQLGVTPSSGGHSIIGNHFQVGRKIGEGSFGVVFEGVNLLTGQIVAIKFEPRKTDAPQLKDECRSYRVLAGLVGIPQTHHYGHEGLHNVLVLDLLGPNLEDLFDLCGRKFSVKTVSMLAKQMITRIQSVHERNLIYRDIKPDNFLIGLPGTKHAGTIFMVDFGMAKYWRDPRTKQHIPYREKKSLSGTARYMSINTHLGREQSRRDDLEGLGHVFMYFLRGSLPWQGLKAATNKQKYEKIGEKKQLVPVSELCEGLPDEFGIYLNYVRKLGFEETPDYDFLRELFTKVLRNAGELEDGVWDWDLLNGGKGWQATTKLPHPAPTATPHRSRAHRNSVHPPLAPSPTPGANGGAVIAPSPALVRHGSKQRKHASGVVIPPNSTPPTPLQGTPRRATSPQQLQQQQQQQHPYAVAAVLPPSPYGTDRAIRGTVGRGDTYPSLANVQYGRNSPGGSAVMIPGVSQMRPVNGHGDARALDGVDMDGDEMRGARVGGENPKRITFLDMILCRCG